jgi:hypothetical protein
VRRSYARLAKEIPSSVPVRVTSFERHRIIWGPNGTAAAPTTTHPSIVTELERSSAIA